MRGQRGAGSTRGMGGAASVETGRRPTVVALDGVDEALMGLVGGKAAGLVRLLRLGLPVPPGIVVTATAFGDLFHDAHARAAALMPQTPDGDACAPLGAGPLVEAEPSLQALVESALDATGLSSEVFAVRSSATDEDAHGSSFAGIHETFLGVPRSCLARAAIRCWASAFAPRRLSS